MRSLYISIVIILILLLSWFFIYDFLNDTVEEINKDIIILQDNLVKEKWDKVEERYNKINNTWRSSLKVLMLVIDHEEMEKVNFSLEQVDAYLKIRDRSPLVGEIGGLKYLINHVKDKEKLSLDNIF